MAGIIYDYSDDDDTARKIFDIATYDPIEGIEYAQRHYGWPPEKIPIHQVAPGRNQHEIYVVFTSTTVPAGLTPLYLPDDPIYDCDVEYKVFVKFDYNDGKFENPDPFFACEVCASLRWWPWIAPVG